MFIRKNSRRGHKYYNVVRGFREEGTVKQEQVLYIGRIDTMTPDQRRETEADLRELEDGEELLKEFRTLLIEHDYDFTADEEFTNGYSLDQLTPTKAVDYGPVRAIHSVSEKLGLENLLAEQMTPKGGGPSLAKLHLITIYSRCLAPHSLSQTVEWYGLTALPELLDLPVEQVTYDALRNSLDYVPKDGMEAVHEQLWQRTQEMYDTPESPLHYDLTSSYLEGTELEIAKRGYSREHRPDKQQIVVGVTVNPDMIPVHHDVYPGNTNDSPTVQGVVERIDALDVSDPLLVGDKAVLTAPNRGGLRGDEDDWSSGTYDYVAPVKLTSPIKDVLKSVDKDDCEVVDVPEGASPLAVTEIDPANYVGEEDSPEYLPDERIRWIVAYNEEKATEAAQAREEKVESICEKLADLKDGQYGTDPLSKEELLTKINRAIPNGKEELIEWSVNERGRPRLQFEINEEGCEEAGKLDGKALFETTRERERLSAESACLAYRDRDTVESFIRTTKEITDLRPYYVRLEQKVRALVFFCVLGVHLIAALQLELEEADIDMTGVRALQKLRGIRRVEMAVEGDQAAVTKTTELSEEQAELLHVFEEGT